MTRCSGAQQHVSSGPAECTPTTLTHDLVASPWEQMRHTRLFRPCIDCTCPPFLEHVLTASGQRKPQPLPGHACSMLVPAGVQSTAQPHCRTHLGVCVDLEPCSLDKGVNVGPGAGSGTPQSSCGGPCSPQASRNSGTWACVRPSPACSWGSSQESLPGVQGLDHASGSSLASSQTGCRLPRFWVQAWECSRQMKLRWLQRLISQVDMVSASIMVEPAQLVHCWCCSQSCVVFFRV